MRALVVIAVTTMLGCGGSSAGSGSATSPANPPGAGSSDAGSAVIAPVADGDAAAPVLLADDECAQMADHMIDVQIAERERAGEELPDPGQLDEIRRGIKAEFVPQCSGVFGREIYDCWMGANSHAEFEGCAGGPPAPQN